ncbi:flippase-like domain-containing protein [Haloarcula sp. S1AR25-5A]|uniref:Flippase-like domain-containing protein n=1 Tax=Haloarcula terrestris TaxID=2950533 RepID=A0AAE4EXF2_9EURY|nr:lysylphosphatidylglycerol synthase transmembrane domain-containing protein [Haloarcula terrestris]MDS0221012.1 flippase-like domain-containing protein [Haloarcula terrestris]
MALRRRRLLLSVLLAGVLLAGFLWVLDLPRLGMYLRETDLPLFAVGVVVTAIGMAAWSESQRHLLAASGATLSPWRNFVVFSLGLFSKQVLPMGHAVGTAIVAYGVGTELDRPYIENLTPVSVAELQSLLASLCLAGLGLGYVAVTLPETPGIRSFGSVLAVVAVGALVLSVTVWYRRRIVSRSVLVIAYLVQMTAGRISRRVRRLVRPEVITAEVDTFYDTIAAVASDRNRVLLGFVWSLVGWVAFSLPLVTSAAALGVSLPVAVAFFVVPTAGFASFVPVPGGLGSVELVLTGLLVAVTGIEPTLAAGITLLYRLCTYWLVILCCGGIVAAFGVTPRTALREAVRRSEPR